MPPYTIDNLNDNAPPDAVIPNNILNMLNNMQVNILRNNHFADVAIYRYPEWTVIKRPDDYYCHISVPSHPTRLRISISCIPLPGNDQYETMIINREAPHQLPEEIHNNGIMRFITMDDVFIYIENLVN